MDLARTDHAGFMAGDLLHHCTLTNLSTPLKAHVNSENVHGSINLDYMFYYYTSLSLTAQMMHVISTVHGHDFVLFWTNTAHQRLFSKNCEGYNLPKKRELLNQATHVRTHPPSLLVSEINGVLTLLFIYCKKRLFLFKFRLFQKVSAPNTALLFSAL